jgi:predicted CXXCH cytochrome family protein
MRRFDPKLPTDQLSQYWTSVHGQRLRKGDQKVATCVSCHGVHGIQPPDRADSKVFPANVPDTCGHCHSNPEYMAEYKIPTDQEEKWKKSVHAEELLVKRDFSAPACNDCHGNHGAYPPGVNSIAEVCGQCHVNNATFFLKSPHKAAFDKLGLPQCVTCHSNHEIHAASDAMLGGAEGSVCRRCHQPGSAGYKGAVEMRQAIDRLKTVINGTETMLTKASEMGMEVSDEQYTVREEVRPELIKVRTQTHLGNPEIVVKAADAAIKTAQKTEASAKSTLQEAWDRRRNLLFPLGLIILVMVLLYLKLRQLERPGNPRSGR